MRKKRNIVYFSENIKDDIPEIREKVDIVLSPKLYWVKVEELGVSKEKEAIKFAPSIFEGQFGNIEEYRFIAMKLEENRYLFIAYNPKDILEKLNSGGIETRYIKNVYTAQTELANIEENLSINRYFEIVLVDGIVSELPKFSHGESENRVAEYLRNSSRSKYRLNFKIATQNSKSLFIASLIPISLITYLGLDIYRLSSDSNHLQSEIERLRDAYSLPSTSFQIKSIRERYEAIEKEQSRIREILFWLQQEKLYRYGKIEYLSISKKGIEFRLRLKNTKQGNRVKSIIQKFSKEADFNLEENILEVSFK